MDVTESGGGGWSLTIGESAPILGDCHIGDSISVNGCCLTVTEFDATKFKVGLAPETLNKTNLGMRRALIGGESPLLTPNLLAGELKVGDKVDLERAVNGHVRFGGHFVQVRVFCSSMRMCTSDHARRVMSTARRPLSRAPRMATLFASSSSYQTPHCCRTSFPRALSQSTAPR